MLLKNPSMRYISIFLVLFLTGVCAAQTVTQSFNEPTVGDVDKKYSLDTSAYTAGLPNNVSGANVVWDFTKVTGAFPIVFDSIVIPSAAPGASAYPSATYAEKRNSINSFFKSTSGPQQTEMLGATSASLSLTFTNSALVATYPISYGYSNTDAVTGTFKYNSTTGVCNGSINVVADGTGTLNFPNGVSFTNVLRVRSAEQLTLSTTFPVGWIYQTIYHYYASGKKYPVLSMQYQNYQLLVGTPSITAQALGSFDYFTVADVGNHEIPAMNIYPNPFSGEFFITGLNEMPFELRFYNLVGELLLSASSPGEVGDSLPSGIYMLEIITSGRSTFRKVVKQ
jgi:hypothetical protein